MTSPSATDAQPLDFERVAYYPGDPILGLIDLFAADEREYKVNLGVGVYLDEHGRLPLMQAVRAAEQSLAVDPGPRGYLPIGGTVGLARSIQGLVFGEGLVDLDTVATIQTLGGSGAVKEMADLARVELGVTKVIVSNPTWANHRAILEGAGLEVGTYRYYDGVGLDVEGMLADVRAAAPGTLVVAHACCHNPTGYDLTTQQWEQFAQLTAERGLLVLLDMAYQGLGDGLDEDRAAVEVFARTGQRFAVANSFSKNFGLYGERVGGLSVVCERADEARRVRSQLCRLVRTNYSSPASHGAALVQRVLDDQVLRADWAAELNRMRERIVAMRAALRAGLEGHDLDGAFVTEQRGMFSFTGLSPEQMLALRDDFGVYGTEDGRICISGLNEGNVEHVAGAISAVS